MIQRVCSLVVFSFFLSTPALAQSCPALCADIVWGDVNGDGAVDITDLSELGGWIAGTVTAVCDGSDVNRDGAIDIADLNNLGAYIAGTGSAPENQFCCDQCSNNPIAGDANEDGRVDISDATAINNYLAGTGSVCEAAADTDADGDVDSDDSKIILDYLFGGGAAPVLECFP